MIVVLDTSAVSAVMRREEVALRALERLRPGEVVLCAPVAAEIRFGLERLPEGRRSTLLAASYARLRAVVAWADWDEAASAHFGIEKARLERAGTPVGDFDVAIAAVALARGAAVATRNPRDFRRIARLAVLDWSPGPRGRD